MIKLRNHNSKYYCLVYKKHVSIAEILTPMIERGLLKVWCYENFLDRLLVLEFNRPKKIFFDNVSKTVIKPSYIARHTSLIYLNYKLDGLERQSAENLLTLEKYLKRKRYKLIKHERYFNI